MRDNWIAGISTGHNASTCLLKNGTIVFYVEEERLSRKKYDDSPFLGLLKILEYTNKIDCLAISVGSSETTNEAGPFIKFALKLGLIDNHAQVFNNGEHHIYHATSGFYSSGFDQAVCVVIDAAGKYIELDQTGKAGYEVESIYLAEFPKTFTPVYKKFGNNYNQLTKFHEEKVFSNEQGIASIYSALSISLGHTNLECGKAMGLSSYGELDETIPQIYVTVNGQKTPNKQLFRPNNAMYAAPFLDNIAQYNAANLCYAVQQSTQSVATDLILTALRISNSKNLVISGGYALNCVANYEYLKHIPNDVNIFIDPPAHDGGQSIGIAKLAYHSANNNTTQHKQLSFCLGPSPTYNYKLESNETEQTVDYLDIVNLLVSENIVAIFQGGSEAGPRALGNRSILFDPRIQTGKDIVNRVKGREWYRPFAGTILEEHVYEWFDMRGINSSPFMMFAVDVLENKKEKIPSIVHVDGTCRVQTVNNNQNFHFYNLIAEFNKQTGVPILFNTSFNLGGEPLVETLDDALSTLRRSGIKYLYLPEVNKLITKGNS